MPTALDVAREVYLHPLMSIDHRPAPYPIPFRRKQIEAVADLIQELSRRYEAAKGRGAPLQTIQDEYWSPLREVIDRWIDREFE